MSHSFLFKIRQADKFINNEIRDGLITYSHYWRLLRIENQESSKGNKPRVVMKIRIAKEDAVDDKIRTNMVQLLAVAVDLYK